MDFYGFEGRKELPGDAFGLFQDPMDAIPGGGPPPAAGGGGKAGDASGKDKEEVIPYHFDSVPAGPTPADVAKIGAQQDAWVAFSAQDAKEAKDVRKIITESDPKKRPAANTFWSYQVRYTERDGKAGITSKEEAEEVLEKVDGLSAYDSLIKKDEAPKVFYYDGNPEIHEDGLDGIRTTAKDGPSSATDEDNPSFNPLKYGQSLEKRLDELNNREDKVEFLLQELLSLLLMGADQEMILQVLRLMETKTRIESSRIAAIVTNAKAKIGDQNKALNKKLVKLLGSKGENIKHGDIQDIRFTLDQNQNLLNDVFTGMLRDATGRTQEFADLISSIAQKIERIAQTYAVWK